MRIKNNVFTEEVNRIALSVKDDYRIQLIDSIEIFAYVTNKNQKCKEEQINVKIIN